MSSDDDETALPAEGGLYDSYRDNPLGALGLRVLVLGAHCGESGARAAESWQGVVVGRDASYVPPHCRKPRLMFRVEFFDEDYVTQQDDKDYLLTLEQMIESRNAYTTKYAAEEMQRLMGRQQALAAEAAHSEAAKAAAAAAAAVQVEDAKKGGAEPLAGAPKPKKRRGPEGQMAKNFRLEGDGSYTCMVEMGWDEDAKVCGASLRPTSISDLGAHMRRKRAGGGLCPFHQRAWRCHCAVRAVHS